MKGLYLLFLIGLFQEIFSWCLKTALQQGSEIREVDWAPDNSILVSANVIEKVVRIYNAKTFELLKKFNNSGQEPRSVKVSKNSLYVAIGYRNSHLVVLHATPPYGVYFQVATGQSRIAQVDFSFDNTGVMSCGDDQGYQIYSLSTQAKIKDIKLTPNPGNAVACRFSSLGHIGYSDNNKRVRIHDSSANEVFQNSSWADDTLELDFKYGTFSIYTACKDNNFRIDHASTIIGDSDDINTVSVGRQGRYYAFGGKTKILRIYNQTTNTLVAKFNNFKNTINSIKFSNDETHMIVADVSGEIKVYGATCSLFSCESGQYNASGICLKCSSVWNFCISCKSAAACDLCMAGYYKSGTSCAACYTVLDSCLQCKDGSTCLKCLDGFYLDGLVCKKCPQAGCIECNDSSICTKCFRLDYYLDTGSNTCKQCTETLSNCIRCHNSSACVDCQIGFYQDPGTKKCLQCPGNCLACQSSTNCTQCKVGYWADGGSCSRCTATGCISCNQTGICYDCKEGTFLTGTNTCTACTNPCASCSVSATNCTGCIVGYYYDSANFKCLKCIENCKICNESAKCLSCFPGFKVDGTSFTCKPCGGYYANCSECSSTQCLKCREGFYPDTAASYACKTCVSAIPNCLYCTNTSSCTQCATSYFHTGNTGTASCGACSPGCQECISAANCTNCFPTHFKNTSLLCEPCTKNKCLECTSETVCTSCVIGYYLDVSTCKACESALAYCSQCTDANTCISCELGAYLDSADNKCKLCGSSCLTCNKTDCFSCQIGYYLDTTAPITCKSCPTFCQECTSSAVCSSCIDGYYFDSADNKCKSCSSTFSHCTLCNKTHCLECDKGTELNTSNSNACSSCNNFIANCKSCYWDYVPATPVVKCALCSYGFGLAATNLTCAECNDLTGCIECRSATLCNKCEIGYFLKTDSTCGLCMDSCHTCASATSCLTCKEGCVNASNTCVLCQSKIDGCSKCLLNTATTFNCTYCQVGYFLEPTDKQCYICHQKITGCYTCNSSTVCTSCLDKFYLDTTLASPICKKCVTNIPGCQLCNSSSVCISCQNSYYLDLADNKCKFCSNNLPGCLHCRSNTLCEQCQAGYYLTASNTCNLCESVIEGCIYCNNNAFCVQCRSGYYLNTADNKCYKCNQPGCEVCAETSPSTCVTCNSKYYSLANSCNLCRNRVPNCDQCNVTDCLSCDVGYFVKTPALCEKCSSSMDGCSRCTDSSTCLECMSSYFVNTSNKCQSCNSVIFGCQNCLNSTNCISCSANFFLNSTTKLCQSCTDLPGCMLCRNETSCVLCQEKYYMTSAGTCLLCSNVIKGCFSCVSDTVCVQCQSGYVLDTASYKCTVNTIEAKEKVEGLKLVSYYVSSSMLKHILYAKGTTFKEKSTLNITSSGKTKLLVEDFTGKEVQLSVISYEFGKNGNSIIFYTDNPLGSQINSKSKKMSFRRLLVDAEINLEVLVKMDEDVYREILPDLDYSGSMTVGYSLNNPEFINSFMASNSDSQYFIYQIVGIVLLGLFAINYIIKFLFTIPSTKNRTMILPHIIALKSCCLIMYPVFFEYINFCKGFMVVDIPWLNDFIASALTDESDHVQVPYGLFFSNMSIAGTFVLGLAAYIVLALIGHAYFYLSNEKEEKQNNSQKQSQAQNSSEQEKQKEFKIQIVEQAIGLSYDNDESQSNKTALAKKNYFELLWNVFGFSLIFYSSVSVQGAFYNYLQVITVNGLFYLLGMLLFIYVTIETFYSFSRNFKAINKVRVYIKACMLSLSHINPIYFVSVCASVDILLTVAQFFLINKKNQFSKFFTATHILSTLCIVLMIFVPESLISIIATGVTLLICLSLQIFIHVKQYLTISSNIEEDFKMDEEESKKSQNQESGRANVWDLGRKAQSPKKKEKGFQQVDMHATLQSFEKQKNFDMENVDLNFEPAKKFDSQSQFTRTVTSNKQLGRRVKNRKTQQKFKPNTIQIVPNPFVEEKGKNKDKFFSDQIQSSSS